MFQALARLFGIDPPRGLGRLLGASASGSTSAITTGALLWIALYAGWHAGVVEGEAAIWLSAGAVVAALHALGLDRRNSGRQAETRGPTPARPGYSRGAAPQPSREASR
ncbi:hypothetical protein [Halolamina salina]|uniref:Uncharacterized protein n=1 Tax=Halolamina salina TaxID=1220023 RepID=A0ABD6B3E9_9EURY